MVTIKIFERLSRDIILNEIMPVELKEYYSIVELKNLSKTDILNLIWDYKGVKLFEEKKCIYHVLNILNFRELQFIKSQSNLDFLSEKEDLLRFIWANDTYQNNQLFKKALHELLGYSSGISLGIKETKKLTSYETILAPQMRFFELFDYQQQIKEKILSRINSDALLLKMFVHMPTGSGKTKTMIHTLIDYYINKMNNKGAIVWLAHTNELIEQAYESFKGAWSVLGNEDINIFRIYDQHDLPLNSSYYHGIFFISYKKGMVLHKKDKNFIKLVENCCLIIVDEAHKSVARETQILIDGLMTKKKGYLNRHLIGLSATPGRVHDYSQSNKSLVSFFDNILINIDISKLTEVNQLLVKETIDDSSTIKYLQSRGILAKLKRETIEYDFQKNNLINTRKGKGEDYSSDFLNIISKNTLRNRKIVEKIIDLYNQEKQVILFACSVNHAQLLESILKSKGVPVGCVFATTNSTEKKVRKKIIADFKSNQLKVLINYEVLTTGFDSKNVDCVFIARPTKSIVLYSQMIGRGLRGPKMGGKHSCLIIDIQDNLNRFEDESSSFDYFNNYWS